MDLASQHDLLLEEALEDLAAARLDAAQLKCMRILTAEPRHFGALAALGSVLHAQGRLDDAARVFRSLTLMQPEVAAHWQNLGAVLRLQRHYDEALAAFENALRLAAPSAGLLYNLGVLQMERLDYEAAYLALRDAAALEPTDATIRWGFAQCCYDRVNREEALAALEGWQTFQGLSVEMTVRIVKLLVSLGAQEQARPTIARLLTDPHLAGNAAVGLAAVLERMQRLDEARALMRNVRADSRVAVEPESLKVSAVLAERAGAYDEAQQLLLSALERQQDFVQRYNYLFPLARIQDAMGRYPAAYATATEAHRSQLAFLDQALGKSAAEEPMSLVRTREPCDADDVARWGHAGPSVEESPIFIVAFPRSGTTLLEQALDAHPLLQSMDEQPYLVRATDDLSALGVRYPAALGALTPSTLDDLRRQYWHRVRQRVQLPAGVRLVDKMPLNMVLLPLIRRLFPNARVVLAIRHPADTILSCFLQQFNAPGLAMMCRDLPALAGAFSQVFGFWYSQAPLLQPASYEIRYEHLVADFEAELRKLADFLQLPWHEAMLEPEVHARAKGYISTPSYAQVVRPISASSVGRWQNYRSHFLPILPELNPWLERWGSSVS